MRQTTPGFQLGERFHRSSRRHQADRARSFVDLARDTGALGVKGVPYTTTVRNIAGGLRAIGDYGASHGSEPAITGEILALAINELCSLYPWSEIFLAEVPESPEGDTSAC
jgi:hypothetical protein